MSASRQERRQLGRSLKALGKAPLSGVEISLFSKELSATSEDVKLAAGRCAACLSTSGERKSCRACSFVRYCSRECQTAGWPSHKLVCKFLAADREIAVAFRMDVSTPLLPLNTIWSRLRSGGHSEAYEAAVHLHVWANRCTPEQESAAAPGHISALRDEITASGGVALLVPGLAAGGLRALKTASLLASLADDHPEMGASIVAAGALPLLTNLVALPSTHADFERYQSLLCAAESAVALLRKLIDCELGPAVLDRALPALVNHFDFASREPSEARPPSSRLQWSERALEAAIAIFDILSQNDESEDEAGFDASAARSCIASGAVPLFISALGSDDGRIATVACEVLSRIVTQSKDGALANLVGSEPSKIIALFRPREPSVIDAPGTGFAANATQRATAEREATHASLSLMKDILDLVPERGPAFSAAVALPSLVALLGDSSDSVVFSAALALDGLFTSDTSSVGVAFDEGVFEILLALLERPDAESGVNLRWTVLGALAAMLRPASLKQKARAVACGAVRLFSECFAGPDSATIGDVPLLNALRIALVCFFSSAGDSKDEASSFYDSVADQILEILPPSLLVSMISRRNTKGYAYMAYDVTRVLSSVVRSPAHHKAFIDAALPRELVSLMTLFTQGPVDSYLIEVRLKRTVYSWLCVLQIT